MDTGRKETMDQITTEGVALLKKHNEDKALTPLALKTEILLSRFDELRSLNDLRNYTRWFNSLSFEEGRDLVQAIDARKAGEKC